MTFLMNKSLKLQTRGLFLWLRPRNQSEEIDDFLAQLNIINQRKVWRGVKARITFLPQSLCLIFSIS